MDFPSDEEREILYLRRIDDLERRLAHVERELQRLSPGYSSPSHSNGNGSIELAGDAAVAAADAGIAADGGESEREGARLVVIEMLTAGYEPEQITTYLRQTFGVEDPEALIQAAGPVAR